MWTGGAAWETLRTSCDTQLRSNNNEVGYTSSGRDDIEEAVAASGRGARGMSASGRSVHTPPPADKRCATKSPVTLVLTTVAP